jgi:hypothetical protein
VQCGRHDDLTMRERDREQPARDWRHAEAASYYTDGQAYDTSLPTLAVVPAIRQSKSLSGLGRAVMCMR